MLRIRRLGSCLAVVAALLAATYPPFASADPWPRERHSALGSYRIIHDFEAGSDRPGSPTGTSLIGPAGLYYGVTANGGPSGVGTIYRMNADRTVTTLHVFDMATGRDPERGLTLGSDGHFYGTAFYGGTFYGGVLYRLSADGVYTMLHAFDDSPAGGRHPNSRLVEGPDGNFYGTTTRGGQHHGHGTFFRMTPSGEVTFLYSFRSVGRFEPYTTADFCLGPDNHFYAMGRYAAYRVALDGSMVEWRRFNANKHGEAGWSGLVLGHDGFLYGAMAEGGPRQGGTVFRLSLSGELTVLHAFHGPADPEYNSQQYQPMGPLMQAADGALYGTTFHGGKWGLGGVFRVSPDRGFEQLVDFAGWASDDTDTASGALVQTPGGPLLGTGYSGGLTGSGTIYALTPAP